MNRKFRFIVRFLNNRQFSRIDENPTTICVSFPRASDIYMHANRKTTPAVLRSATDATARLHQRQYSGYSTRYRVIILKTVRSELIYMRVLLYRRVSIKIFEFQLKIRAVLRLNLNAHAVNSRLRADVSIPFAPTHAKTGLPSGFTNAYGHSNIRHTRCQ